MKVRSTLLLILVFGFGSLSAAPAGGTEEKKADDQASSTTNRGVMTEFRRLEEEILRRRRSPEFRKLTLQSNLLRALRKAIARRFYGDREDLLKNLTAQSLEGNYDNPTSPLVYYVRYKVKEKTIIVRFDYTKDPEFFIQGPAYEKLLIRDESKAHNKEESKKQ